MKCKHYCLTSYCISLSESLLWCLSCNWTAVEEIAQLRTLGNHHLCWDADEDVFQQKSLFPLQGKHKVFTFTWSLKCNLQCKMHAIVKNCHKASYRSLNLLGKLYSHSPCTVSLVNLRISHTVIMTREAWESSTDWLTVQILSKKQSLAAFRHLCVCVRGEVGE